MTKLKQLALFCFHTFKLIFEKPFGSFALPLPQFKFSIFIVVLRVKKAIYEEKEKNLWRGLEFSVCILDWFWNDGFSTNYFPRDMISNICFDFRRKCGVFIFEVVFYSVNFRLFNSVVLTQIFISSESYCYPELKLKKIFHLWPIFLSYVDLKIANLGELIWAWVLVAGQNLLRSMEQ